jgi:hypothetical protein
VPEEVGYHHFADEHFMAGEYVSINGSNKCAPTALHRYRIFSAGYRYLFLRCAFDRDSFLIA